MKKKLIVAGVASAAVAVLPVTGVFASSVTDEIKVNIPASCALVSSTTSGEIGSGTTTTNTYTATMQNGQVKSDIGNTGAASAGSNKLSVSCNATTSSATGWSLSAVGGDGTTVSTVMTPSPATNTPIATGVATSGANSAWAVKITGATGINIQNGFDAFRTIPGTATVVATGSGTVENAFTMLYQVYVGTAQQAGTYTGKVTYTLTSTAP